MSTPDTAELEPITLRPAALGLCPRQCGLIHLEQAFDDNLHTLRGHAEHARVDKPGVQSAKGVRGAAPPLWHDALGLMGWTWWSFWPMAPYPWNTNTAAATGAGHRCLRRPDGKLASAQTLCLEAMTIKPVAEARVVLRQLQTPPVWCPSPAQLPGG